MTRLPFVLLAALFAVVGCGEAPDQGSSEPSTPAPSPTPTPTPSPTEDEVELAPHVDVDDGPVGLTTAADGAVWVVTAKGETVQRIPAGATGPDLNVEAPGVPLRATAAFGSVWVTSFQGKELLRLDPATGEVTARVRAGEGPEGVTSGFGSIWMVAQDAGRLLRIDPRTAEVSEATEIGVGARLVTAGPDAMYVAQYADNTVLRIDPDTPAVAATSDAVCEGPQGMAVLDGKVWVACTLSDEVVALDATTLEKVASVAVTGSPDSVAVSPDGRLVVVAEEGPRLVVLDPTGATVVAELVLGQELGLYDQANLDVTFAGDEVWVSSFDGDRVYHVPVPG